MDTEPVAHIGSLEPARILSGLNEWCGFEVGPELSNPVRVISQSPHIADPGLVYEARNLQIRIRALKTSCSGTSLFSVECL